MSHFLGSFDPGLKNTVMENYQTKYGKENALLIQRSKLFLFLRIILPLFGYMVLYVSLIVLLGYATQRNAQIVGYGGIIGIIGVIILFLAMNLKRLLDYLMDFIIVTPEQIIEYNQTGIRKRSNRTIEIQKIKSITTSYRNGLFSIFNNGDIKFLSEGDNKSSGEIEAFYVANPQKTKQKIYTIMEQNNNQ